MDIGQWIERVIADRFNERNSTSLLSTDIEGAIGYEVGPTGVSGPFAINPLDRLKHLYVLGSTGSGKTNLLTHLIEDDLDKERTVAILDMRGDLVDRTIRSIAGRVPIERVHLVDLRYPERSGGINPFKYGNDPYGSALQIHGILRSAADSWGVQLDETLRCCLIALSYSQHSLTDITRFLTDIGFRSAVVRGTTDPYVTAFFARFEQLSPEKQMVWTLPVLNKVSSFLSHPSIRSILSERTPIDLPEVLDMPGSVLLVALGADRLHGLAGTFGCLMVSAIENSVMKRVDQREELRNPVHLYLDEFENFQSPSFESIIAEGRRFRLGLTLSHQNLHQLDSKLRHVVMNNAGTRIYFRTGATDANELARELGSFGVKDAAKSMLHLPTGQAYVIDRNTKARRIQFRQAKPRRSGEDALEAVSRVLRARTPSPDQQKIKEVADARVKHLKKPRAARSKESDAN